MNADALEAIACRPLFALQATLAGSFDGGQGPLGRRVWDSPGDDGVFEGDRLRGIALSGGGDWRLVRRDGVMVVDARVALRTDDGAVIHMSYGGRIRIPTERLAEAADPARRHLMEAGAYYFKVTPTFETGAVRYAWMNDIVCVGVGRLLEGQRIGYDVYELL